MSTTFRHERGLVIVPVILAGPDGEIEVRMALDTGATVTTVRNATLVAIGLDPAASSARVAMTTASGVEYVPKVSVPRLSTCGRNRIEFAVVAHTLPPSASVDGLLGLDFFRDTRLTLDFRTGLIHIE